MSRGGRLAMDASPLAVWSNFFVAQTGAAAALTGLVIVAISINLARILAGPYLPSRAGETLALLVGLLVISSLALVPQQPQWLLGGEWLVVGGVMNLFPAAILVRTARRGPAEKFAYLWPRILVTQSGSLPFIIGGVLLLCGQPQGLYWAVPGVVFSLIGAAVNTWVLLVEILR